MTRRRPVSLAPLLLVLAAAGSAPAQPAPSEAARQAFMAAMAAVDASATVPADVDPDALRTYVLYPYLQAARLQRRLETATAPVAAADATPDALDAQVAQFLAAQGSAPVARRLREDWLSSLAARKAWPAYLDNFQRERDASPVLQCHALAARASLGRTDGLVEDLTRVWLTGKALPDACDPALAWWRARGGPGDDLVARRARLALEAGEASLARFLARSLPAERAAPYLQWAALIDQAGREIPALIAQPGRAVEPDALEDGWMRFARSDPQLAAATFPALVESRKLDARAASPYALAVALALSWSRLPGALDFYARVHPDDFDERAHEWHARAALWAGDWPRAAAALEAMPETLRSQPRWKYWQARAHERRGEEARAREVYASVIPTDNWYAALAAARLARKFVPNQQPAALSDEEVARLSADPAMVRTRELLLARMEPEATAEWRAALDALPPARQVQAVGLASRWGWYHQAIATAAKQRIFDDYGLLYPRPYDAEVREASRRTGLPRELIYAIIRQESLYRADAGSTAGALGLMQLLPSTARMTARKAGLPEPTRAQLLVPSVNVPLGSEYLAGLVERFDGETALATAGYNAGPNAATRWRPPAPMELDAWVENIPFNETRSYVQRVAWHALVFEWLESREPHDVSRLLRKVEPVPAEAARAD